MTLNDNARSTGASEGPESRRNFILQQGLCEPAAGTCPDLYSALQFQPRVIGPWIVLGTILQAAPIFFALGGVLWWNALFPRLNPFDAIYNRILGRARGLMLSPAPAPRRFAQSMAGSFGLAIGACLAGGARMPAYVLEGMFLVAITALLFGGFCLGSFIYHVVVGRIDFARRTLPWARGEV